jgi:hypothetical protein
MRQHMDQLENYTDILQAQLNNQNNSSDPYQYIMRPVYSPHDVQELDTSPSPGQGNDINELVASTEQLKVCERLDSIPTPSDNGL